MVSEAFFVSLAFIFNLCGMLLGAGTLFPFFSAYHLVFV